MPYSGTCKTGGEGMSVLSKIAYHQGIRSDEPNQLLARELAEANDREGIRKLASNLFCKE